MCVLTITVYHKDKSGSQGSAWIAYIKGLEDDTAIKVFTFADVTNKRSYKQ